MPIWLSLSSRALLAYILMPFSRRFMLVTYRSSPTIIVPGSLAVSLAKIVVGLLLEGVFQQNDGIGLDQIDIVIDQLSGRQPVSVHGVAAFHVEAGGSRVKADSDLFSVAADIKSAHDGVQSIAGLYERRGIAALIADVGGAHAVLALQDLSQSMIGLGSHAQPLAEGLGPGGLDHELLNGQLVSGVLATVENVEGRNGQASGIHSAQVLVERHFRGGWQPPWPWPERRLRWHSRPDWTYWECHPSRS